MLSHYETAFSHTRIVLDSNSRDFVSSTAKIPTHETYEHTAEDRLHEMKDNSQPRGENQQRSTPTSSTALQNKPISELIEQSIGNEDAASSGPRLDDSEGLRRVAPNVETKGIRESLPNIFGNSKLRPTSTLCGNCENVINHWSQVLSGEMISFQHWENYHALGLSAHKGCELCTQFMQGYEETEPYYDGDRHECWPKSNQGVLLVKPGPKVHYYWPSEYWRFELVLPYTRGDLDSGYDGWNDEEALYLNFHVNLVPTKYQGTIQLQFRLRSQSSQLLITSFTL